MPLTKSSCSKQVKEASLSLRKSLSKSNKIIEDEVDEERAQSSKSLTLLAPCSLCKALEILETPLKCFLEDEVVRVKARLQALSFVLKGTGAAAAAERDLV